MYTEILIKASIDNEKVTPEVEAVLQYLFNDVSIPNHIQLPVHPFFRSDRWPCVGHCSSFYHVPWVNSKYGGDYGSYYIFSRSDLKNYDNEIEAFFDWIDPYLDEEKGMCIGYSWYEEDLSPTLVYKK